MDLASRWSRLMLAKTIAVVRHRLLGSFGQTSYAQEGEDIVLRRLFAGQKEGLYVDVGAHHPQRFSNTYLFYRLGWSGVNIDAMPGSMRPFRRLRPRDTNLELAVGEGGPPKSYYIFNERALNTFDPERARQAAAAGYRLVRQTPVATRALRDILSEHLPPGRAIDFLSVDVEGLELEVLRSNDWGRFRPSYVLVETVRADIDAVTSGPVATFLRGHGYGLFAKTANTSIFRQR